jgi:hypothetical protein
MSPSHPRHETAEDLVILARRGGLSASDERELAHALESSAALRTAYQVGRDFDHSSAIRLGDEEMIARAARTALARPTGAKRRGLRLRAAVFGLAAAFVASIAAAWWSVRPLPVAPVESAKVEPPHDPMPVRGPSVHREPEVVENDVVLPQITEDRVPRNVPKPAHSVEEKGTGESALRKSESSAELFRRANAARRSGDLTSARALYTELQTSYPRSDEARLSHVSLGRLLLGAGRAEEADRQFASYLADGGGTLAEEAWVGRAESLERLGRSAAERQIWLSLLESFPSSVYADRARERLEKLGDQRR